MNLSTSSGLVSAHAPAKMAFAQAIVALAASSLTLFSLLLFLMPPLLPERVLPIERWYQNPSVLQTGNPSEWVFPFLSTQDHAVARAEISPLLASEYPVVRVHIEGRAPETEVAVVWRTDAHPTALNAYPIPWSAGALSVLDLGAVPQWTGQVLDVGIMVGGWAPGAIRIHSMELASPSAIGRLQMLWSLATAFEGWHAYSINFAYGGAPANWPLGPVVVAAWVALAALLLAVFQLMQGHSWRLLPFSLILLCGWLLLDARWQLDLARQGGRTIRAYAGQTVADKRSSGDDDALFRFIQSAKTLLPKAPQRILLVPGARDPGSAVLQRAGFYLRPHNVYAEDLQPLCRGALGAGDYVLTLGTQGPIRYQAAEHRLSGNDCPPLPAKRLTATAVGQLFRIGPVDVPSKAPGSP